MDRQTRIAATVLVPMLIAGVAPAPAHAAGAPPLVDSALVMRQGNGGREFNGPLGIAIDTAHGEVVVTNTGHHRVEFFDFRTYPRGAFVHRVPDSTGALVDGRPTSVAVDGEGRILLSDQRAPYVDVVDYRGRPVAKLLLPAPDDDLAGGHGAGALAISSDGEILVASRGEEGRVHVFGPDYRFRRTWGLPGREPGRLSGITALAVTPEGQVVASCAFTELAVQVFEAGGEYLRGWGVHDVGPGNFSFPSGVAVTRDGRIWVSDAIRQVVQVFDPAGSFLGAVGGSGVGPGEFTNPSALASDGEGVLALVESMGNRFQLMWVR